MADRPDLTRGGIPRIDAAKKLEVVRAVGASHSCLERRGVIG